MKSPANDEDFERAFGVLELPPNASREAVEQAYRELSEVWDPSRFPTDERLRRRAAEQLTRIQEAYELLKDYHAGEDSLLQELYGKTKKGRAAPSHPQSKAGSQSPSTPPSLADTVFAEPSSGPSKRLLLALVVGGVVIVVVLALLFLGRPAEAPAPADQGAAPAAATSAPVNEPAPPPPAQEQPGNAAGAEAPVTPKSEPQTPQATSTPLRSREEPPVPQQRSDSARPSREPGFVPPGPPKTNGTSPAPAPRRQPDNKPELVRGPEEGGVAPEEERRVLNVLGQKSPAAQSILDGNTDQFRVMSWRVTKKDGGEFWAHIVAESAVGGTTHLIWAVDPSRETIRPLSQAARDLDKSASTKPPTGS